MSDLLPDSQFRCLYCAQILEITPELPDHVACPTCGRQLVVPGRIEVDLSEFEDLTKTAEKSLKVDYKTISMWILGLTLVNFVCYCISTAISLPLLQGLLSIAFLISSIGLFVIGVNLLLRSRN